MAFTITRREDRIGLFLAISAHAALLALLVWHPFKAALPPVPERMTVTLSEDIALTSTAPAPAPAAASAQPAVPDAPVIEAKAEENLPPKKPEPQKVEANPAKLPLQAKLPKPAPAQAAKPIPPVQNRISRPAARSSAAPQSSAPAASSASRINNDFLKGVADSKVNSTAMQNAPAAAIGPAVQSALSAAISRQLKPRWTVPQGADADKLVTVLSWSLNADGSLAAGPQVVRQEGITDANRAQAARHAEQAMRAVRLAAPFQLPAEYYTAWKRIATFRFDKRLAQ